MRNDTFTFPEKKEQSAQANNGIILPRPQESFKVSAKYDYKAGQKDDLTLIKVNIHIPN